MKTSSTNADSYIRTLTISSNQISLKDAYWQLVIIAEKTIPPLGKVVEIYIEKMSSRWEDIKGYFRQIIARLSYIYFLDTAKTCYLKNKHFIPWER